MAIVGAIVMVSSEHAIADALDDAIARYNNAEYKEALTQLQAFIQQGPHDVAIGTKAYYFLGCAFFALEQEDQAKQSFETVLALDPRFDPGALAPPKIRRFFDEVRTGSTLEAGSPQLSHRAPKRVASQKGYLVLKMEQVSSKLSPRMYWRSTDAASFSAVEPSPQSTNTRVLFAIQRDDALSSATAARYQYYFALVNAEGTELVRLGSPQAPYEVSFEIADGKRWYKTWWFWAATGAAIGLTAGVAAAASGGGGSSSATVTILHTTPGGEIKPIFAP